MGEGMVEATLATIATRSWKVQGQPLTGEQVVAMYRAMGSTNPHAPPRAVGAVSRSDRRFGRAINILQRARLVRWSGADKRWVRATPSAEVQHG